VSEQHTYTHNFPWVREITGLGQLIGRVEIPSVGINQPIKCGGTDEDNALEYGAALNPRFTNSQRLVIGGHSMEIFSVWGDEDKTLFTQLKNVREGDMVTIELLDGTIYTFEVTSSLRLEDDVFEANDYEALKQGDLVLYSCDYTDNAHKSSHGQWVVYATLK